MGNRMERLPDILGNFSEQFHTQEVAPHRYRYEEAQQQGLKFRRVFATFGTTHEHEYFTLPTQYWKCSQNREIPYYTSILEQIRTTPRISLEAEVSKQLHNHRMEMEKMSQPRKAAEIEHESSEALKKICAQVNELVGIFDTYIFPPNIATRPKCSTKGSSLYLPGLIKAVISNYNYKKFYSVKQRGGRRDYAVCIAIDISLSVRGYQTECMFESLLMLITALQELSISRISLITFNETIQIVKSESDPFNVKMLAHLLKSIPREGSSTVRDYGTNDGEAILYALELLKRSQTRGTRHIYVLTDGHSSSPSQVTKALYYAQRAEVPVTAIGVGGDRSQFDRYGNWVHAALPACIPTAFRGLYEGTKNTFNGETPSLLSIKEEVKAERMEEKMANAFGDALADFRSDDTVKMVDSGDKSTIDICYCIDCTGSMNIHLDTVKKQIKKISKDIYAHIQSKFGDSVVVRSAVIAYRDDATGQILAASKEKSESKQEFVALEVAEMEELPFSSDRKVLNDFIDNLKAVGGYDIAEDVLGALKKANQLFTELQSPGNSSFLVLVTDAPGHGLVPAEYMKVCPDEAGVAVTEADYEPVLRELCNKNIDLILMQVSTLTSRMEELFQRIVQEERGEEIIAKPMRNKLEPYLPRKYHFVFVLDQSHSMTKFNRWETLTKAYDNAVRIRLASQADDLLSVVLFHSSARTLVGNPPYRLNRANEFPSLGTCGQGSTKYVDGLNMAQECILSAEAKGYYTKLIFMSDGKPDGKTKKIQEETLQTCTKIILHLDEQLEHKLELTSIAFCYEEKDGDPEILMKMGNLLPGRSEFREIKENDKDDIIDHFKQIAGSEDLSTISQVISGSISEAVKSKLTCESF
uniref:VWFA domain-containing protein n=1 Tax=Vannella robusta TaxID=1487602 RepID=A0A7S4I0I1_9EUKA|mmetsp:Transcript_18568/g.23539  ORF Transcript_18568/g.23539 Transcript_18568/m.23539 type:complete len:868 (+) Transcript_18568:1-2604(+)